MRQAPLPLSHSANPYLYHLKCAYQHLHNCAAFTTIISRTFSSFHRLNCLHLTQIPYPHLPATDCQRTLFCLSPFATCKPSHATFAFPRLFSSVRCPQVPPCGRYGSFLPYSGLSHMTQHGCTIAQKHRVLRLLIW